MKKCVLFLMLMLPLLGWGQTEERTMREVFAEMPKRVLPLLEKNDRLDMLDYMDAGRQVEIRNRLGGMSKLTELSKASLRLELTECTVVEMRLLDDGRVELTTTDCVEGVTDSYTKVYPADWSGVEDENEVEDVEDVE